MAWGNLPLANPDVANGVTHYGYNTILRRATHPGQRRGQQDRAGQERLPRLRRPALPVPGARDRPPGLRDADQPGRDRSGAAGDA
ncbi:MAG: hypothetical protein R2734_12585 [Nocardioides sp.]